MTKIDKVNDLMEKIFSLCKRRGFVFPSSEIYGGFANAWDYGPLGVELKNNIKQLWWQRFVRSRTDMVGIDAALIMNPKVWEASGHVATFSDPLVECQNCHSRFRADQINLSEACGNCKSVKGFTNPYQFNLMFQTHTGPVDTQGTVFALVESLKTQENEQGRSLVYKKLDDIREDYFKSIAYFRPETAQAMFVNFKNVLDTMRKKLPFGIAQQGKAFRNEITPGNFIFRTREFEQMEIEYFFAPPKDDSEWQEIFEMWRTAMIAWMKEDLRLDFENHVHELEVEKADLAHYSKRTIDFEYDFPFGTKELYGLAYRTDFDLANHEKASGQEMKYLDPETNEKFTPHCIEPTWGVDRTILAVLCEHYKEEGEGDKKRVYLSLPARLAPYKCAVFPLLKNKPDLVEKARSIYSSLTAHSSLLPVAWDDRGNVGKRYYSQDEIGTPFCITVDFQTLEDDTVTVRDRDTQEQVRISVKDLPAYLGEKI